MGGGGGGADPHAHVCVETKGQREVYLGAALNFVQTVLSLGP